VVVLLGLLAIASAKIYFQETFSDGDAWKNRWVLSKNKESEGSQGEFDLSAGKYFNDANTDKGLHTTTDARFYQITAEIPEEFSNEGKDLIIQYSVKHEQKIDCGGGYIKLHPKGGMNQANYNGDTPYNVMFGPDICGYSTKKTHLIFNYKGTNHLIKKDIKAETDEWTHLYTMILHADNTYEVQIDGKEVAKGSLKDDYDMLAPKKIKDPNTKKPSDWVDEKMISDPEDKKPSGWDDIPAEMSDPHAKKPEDWDDELDGDWEAPMIANPDYKGEWKARMIENPAYKGEWVHPEIDNPDYVDDNTLYKFVSNKYIGFELWQVKAGTIFDNIVVTDDMEEAKTFAEKTTKTQAGEKKVYEKEQEEERKKKEAEEKAAEEEEEEEPKDEL